MDFGLRLWCGEANATCKPRCSKNRRMGKEHERGGGTATVAGCRRPRGRSYKEEDTDTDGEIEVDEIGDGRGRGSRGGMPS